MATSINRIQSKTSSANDVTYTRSLSLFFYDKKDKLLDKVNFSNAEGADFIAIQKAELGAHLIEWIYPASTIYFY